jgi:hypothetical protein
MFSKNLARQGFAKDWFRPDAGLNSFAQFAVLFLLLIFAGGVAGQSTPWRAATDGELKALLPARATVEKEHIETEMRTASGITDGRDKFVAGIVLITAGYAADGKYSHFMIVQTPLQIGHLSLPAGEYVFGWQRGEESLDVHFYEASTGASKGFVEARRLPTGTRVESFKIWPPQTKAVIQIGRFGMPYQLK